MPKVLIVYYTRSGHTREMAEAVAAGVREVQGAEADLRPVDQVTPDDLLAPDAIVLGSPVYYGTMAAPLKTLIDESVKHHGKLAGKVGAAFATSANVGGGNETTVLDLLKALLIHGMIVEGDPKGDHYGPVAVGAPDDRAKKECLRLGRRVAQLAARLARR